jgi:XTP/dITP diphosphohydrolase
MIKKIVFATNNLNKIKEIQAITPSNIEWISLAEAAIFEELPETRETIEANSLQKGERAFELAGLPCMSEDTGLEVEALHNEPGVRSARYAGDLSTSEENIDKLLGALHEIKNRKARFKTVISFCTKERIIQFEGILNGEIAQDRRGSNGFGYDSVFIPEGQMKTFAEMNLEEKNQMSHRKRAFVKFLSYLKLNQHDSSK